MRRYKEFAELREDLLQLLREEAPARLPLLEVTAVTALLNGPEAALSLRQKPPVAASSGKMFSRIVFDSQLAAPIRQLEE